MARYTHAKCKLCRREGERLYLRGARCHSVKCAIARRPHPPGAQSFRRKRLSDYGVQLREKQKAKRIYGLLERQFRRLYHLASRRKGSTGDNLMSLLEGRIDNVVFLGGFAQSRAQARQLVKHGHIMANGRKITIPSFSVRPEMAIAPVAKEKSRKLINSNLEVTKGEGVPPWLACDPKKAEIRVLKLPAVDEASFPIQSSLIVELLAK
ncbi:MAG: 30S ribosomal protein S4 [Planctomycetes bacterium]|nr:30S ribosomal protein S4 [Planctomycetota bacterium]